MNFDHKDPATASMMIGIKSADGVTHFDLPVAMRRIKMIYDDYIKNHQNWDHNDTHDLIIMMKIVIDSLHGELEKSNKIFLDLKGEMNCRIDHGANSNGHLEGLIGLVRGWESANNA